LSSDWEIDSENEENKEDDSTILSSYWEIDSENKENKDDELLNND